MGKRHHKQDKHRESEKPVGEKVFEEYQVDEPQVEAVHVEMLQLGEHAENEGPAKHAPEAAPEAQPQHRPMGEPLEVWPAGSADTEERNDPGERSGEEKDGERQEAVKKSVIDEEKISEAVRFSLSTLLGITDKIKEVDPQRQTCNPKAAAKNILDPDYQRPWWSLFAGLAGGYAVYRLYKKEKGHGEK